MFINCKGNGNISMYLLEAKAINTVMLVTLNLKQLLNFNNIVKNTYFRCIYRINTTMEKAGTQRLSRSC